MKNILVLGSAGQIGDPFCKYLKKNNYNVETFDIEDVQFEDLRIPNILDNILPDIDFVFFLAFDVGGARYLKKYQDTFEFLHNNTAIMYNTFESLRKHKTPFIFTSSQMSNMNYSSYGVLKSIGEYYTKMLGGMVVKFWNVYGPERNLEKAHVITDFIIKARDNKKIEMMTDGNEERQFLHVEDCSKAMEILALKYNEISRDEELHITSFKWNTIIDVAKIISDYYNNARIIPGLTSDNVQLNKRNEPDIYVLRYWQPEISLKDGIVDVIEKMK